MSSVLYGSHAVHRFINSCQCCLSRRIRDRPFPPQPISHLFDSAELFDCAVLGLVKGDRGAPLNFHHVQLCLCGLRNPLTAAKF